MMISHGENFTLGRNLTLWNQGAGGYQAWRQKVLGQSQEQGQVREGSTSSCWLGFRMLGYSGETAGFRVM